MATAKQAPVTNNAPVAPPPVDAVDAALAANKVAKASTEDAALQKAIERASAKVAEVEAEEEQALSGEEPEEENVEAEADAAPPKKKAPKPVDSDEEIEASGDEEEEDQPEELKTRVFLKAKQRAQRERQAIEDERRRFQQEQEIFRQEMAKVRMESEQVGSLKKSLERLFSGDPEAALELAQGRDLTTMWRALADANDPNRRGTFQQKKEQTQLEREVAELKQILLNQQQAAQQQALAQREAELQQQAIRSLSDPEAFPAIHKRYSLENEWEKEELLKRYTDMAEEVHRETGETPNNPYFFQKVSKRLEKKLRALYLSEDSSKSSEPDAPQAKAGQKTVSISASKLSARASAQKSVHEMNDEEKLAHAIRRAESRIRELEEAEDE